MLVETSDAEPYDFFEKLLRLRPFQKTARAPGIIIRLTRLRLRLPLFMGPKVQGQIHSWIMDLTLYFLPYFSEPKVQGQIHSWNKLEIFTV